MKTSEKGTPRQRAAMVSGAMTVPTVRLLAGTTWLTGLIAAVALFAFLWLLSRGKGNQTIPECLSEKKKAAKPLLLLTLLWLMIFLPETAREAVDTFPRDSMFPFAPIVLLCLAAGALSKGAAAAERACAAAWLLLWVVLTGVILIALPQIRGEWLTPSLAKGKDWFPAASVALLPSLGLFLPTEGGKQTKIPWPWGITGLLLPAVPLVTVGCLSPELAASLPHPFYTMTQSLRVVGIAERFEGLVSACLVAGSFCLICLTGAAAAETAQALFGLKNGKAAGAVVCLISIPLLWLRLPEAFTGAFTALGLALFPIFAKIGRKKG